MHEINYPTVPSRSDTILEKSWICSVELYFFDPDILPLFKINHQDLTSLIV